MNEFNVLLNAATNGTPSGSLFDALFARYIAPQESWRELESPLPITILAAGEDLIDYRIYGNTENGESAGERTENVFNFEELMAAPPGLIGTLWFTHCLTMHLKPNTNYTMLSNGRGSIDGDPDLNRSIYFNNTDAQNAVFAGHPVTARTNSNGEVKVGIISDRPNAQQYINNTAQMWCVEGSTAPTSYIPYGYKLPMVVRSRNLFDVTKLTYASRFLKTDGTLGVASVWSVYGFFDAEENTDYYLWNVGETDAISASICFYDENQEVISGIAYNRAVSLRVTSPLGCKYIQISVLNALKSIAMLIKGSTAPTEYIPYYRTDTPIYIGSDPLAEDEYVDFGEQKIYRMINGTLTPTDPPVPIPALPTIEGETIIDYNPSTTPAVEPEKMYVKYKSQ